MGIRCTQDFGLSKAAREFLDTHAILVNHCSHCGRFDGYKHDEGEPYGMFDELRLKLYHLSDGKVAKEYIQESIWDSGPMIFLGLIVSDGTMISWSEEEISPYRT
jgi:hypothetical protein